MKSTIAIIFTHLLSTSISSKFSLPLFKGRNTGIENPFFTSDFGKQGSQNVISNSRDDWHDERHQQWFTKGLPLHGKHDDPFMYTTNISLGTPPQSFRAIVDINWSESFVRSTNCHAQNCKGFPSYDSSASSTYSENGTSISIFYYPFYAHGQISSDTMSFAGQGQGQGPHLEIPRLEFAELKRYQNLTNYDDEFSSFDTILGLSIDREWPSETYDRPGRLQSPFRQMSEQGILDRNMFSVLWPRHDSEVGNITFGGYDEDIVIQGEMVAHPLRPKDTTRWQISVNSITVRWAGGASTTTSSDLSVKASNASWTAQLMNRSPYLGLPHVVTDVFFHNIERHMSDCSPILVVDCDKISDLPEIIIGLEGQDITIHPVDYVQKAIPQPNFCSNPPEECMILMGEMPEYLETHIGLGMSFLKKVYSIFDWDSKSISFGILPKEHITS